MDELQKAIKTARDVHDRSEDMSRTHVAVGALIRAVELLAIRQCDCLTCTEHRAEGPPEEGDPRPAWQAWGKSVGAGEVLPREDEPVKKPDLLDTFSTNLIQIVANMIHARTPLTMIACQDFARAILAELAKTPVALPTDEEISNALHVEPGHSATIVANLFRDRVAPVIAAKDARLETERDAAKTRVAELESAAAEAIATYFDPISVTREGFDKLELRLPDGLIDRARLQNERTNQLNRLQAQIIHLDKSVVELEKRLVSNAATLADQVKYTESLLADRARQNDEVESLKACLADARTRRDILSHQCSAIQTTLGATISESATDVASRVATERTNYKIRISDLEKHSATLECLANQYKSERDHGEETRRIQVQRIIELEKKLTETTIVPVDASDASVERVAVVVGENGGDSLSSGEMERIAKAMIVYFAKRIPVDANGKTPGDVYREVHLAHYEELTKDAEQEDFHRIYRESEDVGVGAVLRAFGNGAESLRRVRKAIYDIPLNDESRNRDPIQIVDDAAKIIDAELAKQAATPTIVSKFDASKNNTPGHHAYPGIVNGEFSKTSNCENGCGAWMGGSRSGAPEGVDAFGACPKSPCTEYNGTGDSLREPNTYCGSCPLGTKL